MTTTADIIDSTERLPVAAKRTKVPERTLRNWIDAGQLPAWRVGGRLRVRLEDIDKLAQPVEPTLPPPPPPPAVPDVPAPEAARRLGMDSAGIRQMVRKGTLRGTRVDGRVLVDGATVAELERLRASIPADAITRQEAAKRLGASAWTVEDWLIAGRLRGVKFGGRWHVDPESVAAFARLNREGL